MGIPAARARSAEKCDGFVRNHLLATEPRSLTSGQASARILRSRFVPSTHEPRPTGGALCWTPPQVGWLWRACPHGDQKGEPCERSGFYLSDDRLFPFLD